MDPDDGVEDDGPLFAWLPPDDRLWRHPSELAAQGAGSPGRLATMRGVVRAPVTRTWTVALVAGVVGALVASGVTMATGTLDGHTTVVQPVTRLMSPDTVALATDSQVASANWPTVADSISPSIVTLHPAGVAGMQTGSGVLYAQQAGDAYILTTDQLVDNIYDSRAIPVIFSNGEERYGWLRGRDATTGIALVEVAGANRALPSFGTVLGLKSAQAVMAVSSPMGGGATPGTVSSLDQEVEVTDGPPLLDMIAVSGPASSANSGGGALVDQNGAVVGITSGVTSSDPSQDGLSFFIPIDIAQHVARQILLGGKITHPWLGVTDATDLSSATARLMGLTGGAQVESVAPGSPASALGISQNDVITQLDGQAVESSGDLTVLLANSPLGTQVSIAYLHRGRPTATSVTIEEQPANVDG